MRNGILSALLLVISCGGGVFAESGSQVSENYGTVILQAQSSPQYFLDGRTSDGSIGMAMATDQGFTGTHWQLLKLSDGTFALKTLGAVANPSYLYARANSNGAVTLTADLSDVTTHWKLARDANNRFSLQSSTGWYLNATSDDGVTVVSTPGDKTGWKLITWIGVTGSETPNLPSDGRTPVSRDGGVTWTDSNGLFWLFGGYHYSNGGGTPEGRLNDLWAYDSAKNTWTLAAGSTSPSPPSQPGVPDARSRSASWVDKKDNLWVFGGSGVLGTDLNDLWYYSPQGNWVHVDTVANSPRSRQGSVGWTDAAGNFWLFGGTFSNSGDDPFLNDLWKFDPVTRTWTQVRGSDQTNQVANYGPGATATPGGTAFATSWVDGDGNFWLFGGEGFGSQIQATELNDLWKFNPKTQVWSWVSGSKTGSGGSYQSMGIGYSSKVYYPTPRTLSVGLTDSKGILWLFGGHLADANNQLWKYDPKADTWTWVSGAFEPSSFFWGIPTPRFGGAGWIGRDNNLWIFSGTANLSATKVGGGNDLRKYYPY